ncbi:hypothetical protein L914_19724 [Phytophthora nicotianae]|uniref:Uncharacterized protein n=1 Tax=Phytophthora nicotianae TaxID=4792 RepID=W2MBG2_PHYNI|nr:hypothetical protein L916_19826 [Phytophthora nicotianae]ETM32983.1 hypothetical protein L914_19724 [Phytophthora nicotianae]
MNFLHSVENALRNRLRSFRMRYDARGMTRYPGTRSRETCANRGRQLARQLV